MASISEIRASNAMAWMMITQAEQSYACTIWCTHAQIRMHVLAALDIYQVIIYD
jgi:hypothetical protein